MAGQSTQNNGPVLLDNLVRRPANPRSQTRPGYFDIMRVGGWERRTTTNGNKARRIAWMRVSSCFPYYTHPPIRCLSSPTSSKHNGCRRTHTHTLKLVFLAFFLNRLTFSLFFLLLLFSLVLLSGIKGFRSLVCSWSDGSKGLCLAYFAVTLEKKKPNVTTFCLTLWK